MQYVANRVTLQLSERRIATGDVAYTVGEMTSRVAYSPYPVPSRGQTSFHRTDATRGKASETWLEWLMGSE